MQHHRAIHQPRKKIVGYFLVIQGATNPSHPIYLYLPYPTLPRSTSFYLSILDLLSIHHSNSTTLASKQFPLSLVRQLVFVFRFPTCVSCVFLSLCPFNKIARNERHHTSLRTPAEDQPPPERTLEAYLGALDDANASVHYLLNSFLQAESIESVLLSILPFVAGSGSSRELIDIPPCHRKSRRA